MAMMRSLLLVAVTAVAVIADNAPMCHTDRDHLMLKAVVRHNNDTVVYRTIEEAYEHVVLEQGDVASALAQKLRGVCVHDVIVHTAVLSTEGGQLIPFRWIPTQWQEFWNDTFVVEVTVHEVVANKDFAIFPLIKQAKFSEVLDLIESGNGVNAVDEWGFTPLMRVIAVKQPVVIAALLNSRKARVDIHKQRPSGHTALFYAAVFDHPSILRLLLRMHANPAQQLSAHGSRGSTPLHFACMFGLRKNAEVLLEFGADPEVRNEAGATPFDLIDNSLPLGEIHLFEQLLNNAIQKKGQKQLPPSTASEL